MTARPEIHTSDGAVASVPDPELVAQRAQLYGEWVIKVSGKRPLHHEFVRIPAEPLNWTPVAKPLNALTVALVTTGGVHLSSQTPFAVFDEIGDWSSRRIPGSTDTRELTVTHTHYAIQDALEDVNVIFPLDRLRELAVEGAIGRVAPLHFGFMGFIPDASELVRGTARAAAAELVSNGVEAVVLTGG